jgi:hypothetical protein
MVDSVGSIVTICVDALRPVSPNHPGAFVNTADTIVPTLGAGLESMEHMRRALLYAMRQRKG